MQVDLGLSAHANAAAHFDIKKRHLSKQGKTLAANQQALKAAERKAQQQLSQVGLPQLWLGLCWAYAGPAVEAIYCLLRCCLGAGCCWVVGRECRG